MAGDELEDVEFKSAEAFDRWLLENQETKQSVWGVFWKKAARDKYIDRKTLLRTLLRYGWVDSLPRKLDKDRSKLLMSPRKPNSAWSAVNKAVIAELERDGSLHPAGRKAVETAKANGSWSLLDDVEKGVIPDDLANALDRVSNARTNFDAFPKSARRGILEWIKQAKRPQTRAKRIEETARLAGRGERALDWKNKRRNS